MTTYSNFWDADNTRYSVNGCPPDVFFKRVTNYKTDNQIIADFMKNDAVNSPHLKNEEYMDYDLSFDSLIPVVHKIALMDEGSEYFWNVIKLSILVDIYILHKAVVKFLRYYNNEK